VTASPETDGHPGGAVASPHWAATAVGHDVLASGGNALDAAIATNAMLGVVYPHMCGVGGDLFLLHHEAATGTVHCLNGTGGAPALATPDAFADRGLDAVPARGPLSVTVPGTVGAWDAALRRFGSRPLADLLEPAIAAARDGVVVTDRLAAWITGARDDLAADPTLRRILLDEGAAPRAGGDVLRQPELAATLQRIARAGAADLYAGELGDRIGHAVRAADGLLRASDLHAYRSEWVAPVATRVGGLDVLTTPPNSQGITALLMLDFMGASDGRRPGSAAYVEDFVAAKRLAFALRDRHVTDPRHMAIAPPDLLAGAVPSAVPAIPPAGGDTVYLCTVDAAGNACSLIQSLYYGFGSCYVAGDTGVLLHNRAHYFSLDHATANVLAPGKRTLHTLMACMALESGRLRHVFGTMGADGQPQTNVQVLHRLLAGESPQAAVAAPRVLHGRFVLEDDPETLHVEADVDAAVQASLGDARPRLNLLPPGSERMGHAHAMTIAPGGRVAVGADPRSDGSTALVGPPGRWI
jgi:gamma-glutamyltranspeptidase